MNGKMYLEISVKFADSIYMGKDLLEVSHVSICKRTGSEIQPMSRKIKFVKAIG